MGDISWGEAASGLAAHAAEQQHDQLPPIPHAATPPTTQMHPPAAVNSGITTGSFGLPTTDPDGTPIDYSGYEGPPVHSNTDWAGATESFRNQWTLPATNNDSNQTSGIENATAAAQRRIDEKRWQAIGKRVEEQQMAEHLEAGRLSREHLDGSDAEKLVTSRILPGEDWFDFLDTCCSLVPAFCNHGKISPEMYDELYVDMCCSTMPRWCTDPVEGTPDAPWRMPARNLTEQEQWLRDNPNGNHSNDEPEFEPDTDADRGNDEDRGDNIDHPLHPEGELERRRLRQLGGEDEDDSVEGINERLGTGVHYSNELRDLNNSSNETDTDADTDTDTALLDVSPQSEALIRSERH